MAELEEIVGEIMRAGPERLAGTWRKLDQIQMELIQALHVEGLLIREAEQPLQV